MDKFTTLTGVAAPLPMRNIDTDMIIPKQFLKTIQRTGLGKSLFFEIYNNCFQNGILPIKLPQSDVDKLMDDAGRGANATLTVDLEAQEIRGPDGGVIAFEIDPFRKHCLLNGLDNIGLTMEKVDKISAYEAQAASSRPWL